MPQYIVGDDGKRTHILLSFEENSELIEEREDISDVNVRMKLDRRAIPHEEVPKIHSE